MKDEKERKAILALRSYLQLLQNGNRVAGGRMSGLAALVRLCDASLGDFAAEAEPQQKPSRLISTRLMEEIERLERYLHRIRNAALACRATLCARKTRRRSRAGVIFWGDRNEAEPKGKNVGLVAGHGRLRRRSRVGRG